MRTENKNPRILIFSECRLYIISKEDIGPHGAGGTVRKIYHKKLLLHFLMKGVFPKDRIVLHKLKLLLHALSIFARPVGNSLAFRTL